MSDPLPGFDHVRTRIAPSPTGDPHVGNFYIALFNYVFARKSGGEFIIRIEDTDRTRFVEGAEGKFLDAMGWLGLDWAEGPDKGGPHAPYRQSERTEIYREHARRLVEAGKAYPCFCTAERLSQIRKAQAAGQSYPGYDRHCRHLKPDEVARRLAAGDPHVIRLAVPLEGSTAFRDLVRGEVVIANAEVDDQVLLKSDGFPTYHLASVVDDHLMRISHVCRAEEWISSTPKHVLLYQAFGWQMPQFIHMPLLRNADRTKISKRKNPTSIIWYRERGYLPEALRNYLALMGWSIGGDRETFTLDEMIEAFSWDRVKTSGPVFDLVKLDHMNGVYIRSTPVPELARRIVEGGHTRRTATPRPVMEEIVRLVQERMERLEQFDELTGFFFEREPYDAGLLVPKKATAEAAAAMLDALVDAASAVPSWSAPELESAAAALADAKGWKRRDLYMVLRVAVTCRQVSTPLFETMAVIGREECLARMAQARAALGG